MSNHAYGTYPPRKRRNVWPWIIGGALVAMLIVCSVAISTAGSNNGEGAGTWSAPPATATDLAPALPYEPEPETEATTEAPAPKPSKTAKPRPTIDEGIWHVGEDVPAGTYRTEQQLTADQLCYWERSETSDSASIGDIIANANPSGGRPQVTLKKGEWFTTNRCGTWIKK